jgi:predicted porin
MKKIFIATAIAASVASLAHAQSSVTLYGTLDAGINYTSNVANNNIAATSGHSRWAAGSGSIEDNRFGLRGSEELGGGMKAIFTLEEGFDLSNGQSANGGKMFSRQAFVGLSNPFGTLTLGRQYDATQDFLAPLSATGSWGGMNFAHYGNLDQLDADSDNAKSNTVKFSSANYAGVTFGGTYSFSNSAQFANNRAYSVGFGYENAGLRIGASYAQQNNPFSNAVGAVTSDGSEFGSVEQIYHRARQYGVGASYTFGPAVVGAVWSQGRFNNDDFGLGSTYTNNYELNAKYNLTPALGLGAAYTYFNGVSVGTKFHGNQLGLQADYALSKRTDLYAQGVFQMLGSTDGVVRAVVDNGSSTAFASSRRQGVGSVGIRHRF